MLQNHFTPRSNDSGNDLQYYYDRLIDVGAAYGGADVVLMHAYDFKPVPAHAQCSIFFYSFAFDNPTWPLRAGGLLIEGSLSSFFHAFHHGGERRRERR